MKTIGQVISDIGLADRDIQEFVKSQRKNPYPIKRKDGYYIAYKHKFYKNDIDKLISQEKYINKIGCTTPDQAWINATLVLLNIDESMSFLE